MNIKTYRALVQDLVASGRLFFEIEAESNGVRVWMYRKLLADNHFDPGKELISGMSIKHGYVNLTLSDLSTVANFGSSKSIKKAIVVTKAKLIERYVKGTYKTYRHKDIIAKFVTK